MLTFFCVRIIVYMHPWWGERGVLVWDISIPCRVYASGPWPTNAQKSLHYHYAVKKKDEMKVLSLNDQIFAPFAIPIPRFSPI